MMRGMMGMSGICIGMRSASGILRRVGKKFCPAVCAAKIIGFSFEFCVLLQLLSDRHAANGVFQRPRFAMGKVIMM